MAKPVQAADIEISKEGPVARVKKAPAGPGELESEPGAWLAWHHDQRQIRTGESGLKLRRRQGTTDDVCPAPVHN